MKIRLVALAAALCAGQGWAEESNVYRFDKWQGDFEYEEAEAWKEGAVTLPPYPESGDLLEVPIDLRGYDFFIDTKHLTLGKDGVTRYTAVIRSASRAENVFFEGIHCITQEYRGYGYGSSDGKIHALTESEWRPVHGADTFGYRYQLARFYLCDQNTLPLEPEKAIERIRYNDDDGFLLQ